MGYFSIYVHLRKPGELGINGDGYNPRCWMNHECLGLGGGRKKDELKPFGNVEKWLPWKKIEEFYKNSHLKTYLGRLEFCSRNF